MLWKQIVLLDVQHREKSLIDISKVVFQDAQKEDEL
jgi:hypothetical protein